MERTPVVDAWLQAAASDFGTPCYVYFLSDVAKRREHLVHSFGGRFQLSFAVKCNPNLRLLSRMRTLVDFLDVSSIGEFRLALNAGWSSEQLSFTGPGKREPELAEAINAGLGELVVESVGEAVTASRIATALGRRQRILIRLSPTSVPKGFGDQMAGRPSPFGIDVEDIGEAMPAIMALPGLDIHGLHIYAGTQCLKAAAVCENYRNFISIFEDVCGTYALAPKKLVFGSGLGIPYHMGDAAIDLEEVAADTNAQLDVLSMKASFKNCRYVLELGRYLVGEAGYFVIQVVSIKESRGTRIAICDGGMNHHLPASGHFGMVMHRNYPMHKVGDHQGPIEAINLVGPLCTSIDRLANGIALPRLEVGDLVAIHSSGAYGPTASPTAFISHPRPREILIAESGMSDVTG